MAKQGNTNATACVVHWRQEGGACSVVFGTEELRNDITTVLNRGRVPPGRTGIVKVVVRPCIYTSVAYNLWMLLRDFVCRYLQEVVQKAMDVHAHADANLRPNPLLAAYQVCHDMCCSMVLEILHAQARKLATRVGGLWATQLVVLFHKDSQASAPQTVRTYYHTCVALLCKGGGWSMQVGRTSWQIGGPCAQ